MYVASIEQNVIHLPKLQSCWQHSSAAIAEWQQIFFWWPIDNIKLGALRERSIKHVFPCMGVGGVPCVGVMRSTCHNFHRINLPWDQLNFLYFQGKKHEHMYLTWSPVWYFMASRKSLWLYRPFLMEPHSHLSYHSEAHSQLHYSVRLTSVYILGSWFTSSFHHLSSYIFTWQALQEMVMSWSTTLTAVDV